MEEWRKPFFGTNRRFVHSSFRRDQAALVMIEVYCYNSG